MADIRALNVRRGTIKAQLTRFHTYLNSQDHTNLSKDHLKIRLNQAEKLYDRFEEVQGEIDQLEQSEEQTTERLVFEGSYFDAMALASRILDKITEDTDPKIIHNDSRAHDSEIIRQILHTNVKLPTINLPIFSGAYEEWMQFYDMFNSLIHTNNSLNSIQKFHYLRSSLKGEAAHVISSLEVSTTNYEVAWKLLKERFENHKLIINNHVKALFELSSITKESHVSIRQLLSDLLKHLRALQALNQPTDQWDTLMIYIISSKLDIVTKREWESVTSGNDLPTMDQMIEFLTKRAKILESIYSNSNTLFTVKNTNYSHNNRSNRIKETVSYVTAKPSCPICKRNYHALYRCYKYLALPVKTRLEEAKKLNVCLNCLRSGHLLEKCNSSNCSTCNKKHNSLLHLETQDIQKVSAQVSKENNNTINGACYSRQTQTLLPTALVRLIDRNGKNHIVRVLLDTGSQSNFISKDTCYKLNLNYEKSNLTVSGINRTISKTNLKCNVKIQSLNNSYNKLVTCYVIPNIINNMPMQSFDTSTFKIPNYIELADTSFNQSSCIDMLLGASTFFEILCSERVTLGKGLPIFQKTLLGWVAVGTILSTPSNKQNSSALFCIDEHKLHNQLEKFWQIEETNNSPIKYSKQEEECEAHFVNTFKRSYDGRFIVTIPLQDNIDELGDTKNIAINRMNSIEAKFKRNNELKNDYVKFLEEYEQLGHMTEIKPNSEEKLVYYLPHHPVVRQESLTTKLRVVFDATTPPPTGFSLNKLQKVGPTIQSDIFAIITRFRIHAIALTADVEKMYRQVLITEPQRSLQRIVWRTDTCQELKHYQLNTITYGMAASPFLAIRCLVQLGLENKSSYPKASDVILNDFYVDDLLSGARNLDEAVKLYKDISCVLEQGKFKLRKWASNSQKLLKTIGETNAAENSTVYICENTEIKTLGVLWMPEKDIFQYTVKFKEDQPIMTKRIILSIIAQIYDPLGWISPVTIIAKMFMQKLWQSKLNWDDQIDVALKTEWCNIKNSLINANQISIPRYMLCPDPMYLEMHGFSDASEKAYGACVYIKAIDKNNTVTIHLTCSKTKVAPLKTISIPRLELNAAVLLTRLASKTAKILKLHLNRIVFWTDSTIVLCWIKTSPHLLNTFVGNRVTEIQTTTLNNVWRHISTHENPADIASRGVCANTLQHNKLWWHGPEWLMLSESNWPESKYLLPELPELKNKQSLCNIAQKQYNLLSKFSNFNKLKRVVGYILRFKYNSLKLNKPRQTGPLTVTELNLAFKYLVKWSQIETFSEDINRLKKGDVLKKGSKLTNLNPYLDDDGILRVGGRLANSTFEFDKKHPMILSAKHTLVQLLMVDEHKKLHHAGPQQLLCQIREKIWPINGRNLAKKTVRNCMRCFRANPKSLENIMGNLPTNRLQITYPFNVTGVDYAGPFILKDRKGRNPKKIKTYVSLFVCFLTKAIHLELVSDLSTEAFLTMLRRFISRRGKPAHIYSDNGTQFVGANNRLRELGQFLKSYSSKIIESCAQEEIDWHFIPAQSPHFGGLWEAGIKCTKYHLRRVLGTAALNFEDFYSVLNQIEAVLNSRPICTMSDDSNDLQPLTPAHFLIGRSMTTIGDPNVQMYPINRLTSYQRIQQLIQHFWTRWTKEYVSELQQRQKWRIKQQTIQIGTVVLIKEDGIPPLCWILGKVVQVHPGNDGIIRVVTLRTSKGCIVKRAITKICPLPTDDETVS